MPMGNCPNKFWMLKRRFYYLSNNTKFFCMIAYIQQRMLYTIWILLAGPILCFSMLIKFFLLNFSGAVWVCVGISGRGSARHLESSAPVMTSWWLPWQHCDVILHAMTSSLHTMHLILLCDTLRKAKQSVLYDYPIKCEDVKK